MRISLRKNQKSHSLFKVRDKIEEEENPLTITKTGEEVDQNE